MAPKLETTRRGFLRSIGTVAVGTTACRHELASERAKTPTADVAHERVRVRTTVNGEPRALDVHPDDSALELARARLGLTGSKHGCGHGACGACTMLVDGTPVATCILPATSLEGRTVTTIEAIGPDTLHPVQRAFMAEDGLQCGYCTPGFIVEASAFHDRWRREHGTRMPTRDQVAAALAGHLCRCAAYEQIYAAVQAACQGKHDARDPVAPRLDAREKVTGRARYVVDTRLEGMLYASVLRSPHAHARVRSMDWSKALAHPGVAGAIELLPESKLVRFAGQEIMALAAVDQRTADEALGLVEIEYEVRPAVVGMKAARAPGATPVYASSKARRKPPNASEGPLIPEGWDGNVRGPLGLFSKQKRRARRAIEDARKGDGGVSEGSFRTQVQCHTALEPHACVAAWDGLDKLTVHLSTQALNHMHEDIAQRWGLKKANVRVLAPYVGGAFGAKATLTVEAIVAVELARVTGAPVLYALDRRAEIMVGGYRPGNEIEFAMAADRSGQLTGFTSKSHGDAGVAAGTITGLFLRVVYPKPPRELVDWDVINHAPPGKPFRGPGGPPSFWALESTIDDLAHTLGHDPVAMRRKFDPNPARNSLYDWVDQLPAWTERPSHQADKGRFRRGVGLATGAWLHFVEPAARVQIDASPDGIVASTATQDIGQGVRTVIGEAIAQVLGVALHTIDVRLGDSSYVPGPQAGGSRTTASIVPAAEHAAEQLREELVDVAEAQFGVRDAVAAKGGVLHGGGLIPWTKVLSVAPRITVVGRRRRDKGGWAVPPIMGLATGKYITGSVHVSHVEVDTRIGRVRVLESWGGFAVGRIVSPVLARSQAAGGMIQGIGYTLYEERRLDPTDGYLLTGGLEDYRVPGIGDIGKINVHFVDGGYEKVRGRAVGLGELVTLAPPPSIGNAVFHATGWRPRELPLRPDRVLAGLRG